MAQRWDKVTLSSLGTAPIAIIGIPDCFIECHQTDIFQGEEISAMAS